MPITKEQIDEFRAKADEAQPHVFTPGLIGGSCHRCGSNSGNPRKCHARSSATIDRRVFHELLNLAEQGLDAAGELVRLKAIVDAIPVEFEPEYDAEGNPGE